MASIIMKQSNRSENQWNNSEWIWIVWIPRGDNKLSFTDYLQKLYKKVQREWSFCQTCIGIFLLMLLKLSMAPVALSSERLPPTSEVKSSNLVFKHWSYVVRVGQHSAESRGFSPGSPVSSHREVDGWVRINN